MRADAGFKLLGRELCFSVGGEEKVGRLVRIEIRPDKKMLVGIDENGFIEEYEIADVKVLQNKEEQKSITRQVINQVNKDINSFKFDLVLYREEELLHMLDGLEDEALREQVRAGFAAAGQAGPCGALYQRISRLGLSEEEKELLCGAIAYKQHDRDKAYQVFSGRWLADRGDPDKCRDFILVADEFDNEVLCFFLLNEFFENHGRYIGEKYYLNLWWKYICCAVKYNYFDLLRRFDVNEWNVRYILDSFVYIFHMYNMGHISDGLANQLAKGSHTILQRNNEDLGDIQETIEEIDLLKNYLPDTAQGYYLRFEACMRRILAVHENGQADSAEDEKPGYIYEFVKSRDYGFIVGYDFQKYFYHGKSLSPRLQKKVMENIYSDVDVASEDKIDVLFRSEVSNKRVQATEII